MFSPSVNRQKLARDWYFIGKLSPIQELFMPETAIREWFEALWENYLIKSGRHAQLEALNHAAADESERAFENINVLDLIEFGKHVEVAAPAYEELRQVTEDYEADKLAAEKAFISGVRASLPVVQAHVSMRELYEAAETERRDTYTETTSAASVPCIINDQSGSLTLAFILSSDGWTLFNAAFAAKTGTLINIPVEQMKVEVA